MAKRKKCLKCGEMTILEALQCRSCGANLENAPIYEVAEQDDAESSRAFHYFIGIIFTIIIAIAASVSYQPAEQTLSLAERQKAQEREEAVKAQMEEQRLIDYFKSHKEAILSSITDALASGNYPFALDQYKKYQLARDPDLATLYRRALKDEETAKTKEIVERLKAIPASDFKLNVELYRKLVDLNPKDQYFKKKVAYYAGKLQEQEEAKEKELAAALKEQEARIAKFGEAPEQSRWDGSYLPVTMYLQQVAKDPDSIDITGCTKVYHTKQGWLVGCDYRGRNSFGALTMQSNWFTIVHNRVVEMHPASYL